MKKLTFISLIVLIEMATSCEHEKDVTMDPIANILNTQIQNNKTPGVQYYFFNSDSVIYSFEGGFADIEKNMKVTNKSTFGGYSMTKTFTALAILQLAEKGLLGIDDKISDHLPDFPYSNTITIRHILTHSAGIPNPMPLKWIHSREEHDKFNRDAFFNEILQKHHKTRSEPNEKTAYSNLGYVILGQIIETKSGLTYEDYVRQNILDTLQISKREMYFLEADPEKYAKGYQKKFSLLNLMFGLTIDKSKFVNQTEGKWISFREMLVNGPSYGGLKGTGSAFAIYLQELLRPDCRLISDEYKQILFTENILISGKPSGVCLSWFKGESDRETYFTHAGGAAGFYCEMRIYPKPGKGSVIMFNRSGIRAQGFLDKVDKFLIRK